MASKGRNKVEVVWVFEDEYGYSVKYVNGLPIAFYRDSHNRGS